jgi:hypothetical protein
MHKVPLIVLQIRTISIIVPDCCIFTRRSAEIQLSTGICSYPSINEYRLSGSQDEPRREDKDMICDCSPQLGIIVQFPSRHIHILIPIIADFYPFTIGILIVIPGSIVVYKTDFDRSYFFLNWAPFVSFLTSFTGAIIVTILEAVTITVFGAPSGVDKGTPWVEAVINIIRYTIVVSIYLRLRSLWRFCGWGICALI